MLRSPAEADELEGLLASDAISTSVGAVAA
jgi:hypothetical protein